jgi:hypothetical protein
MAYQRNISIASAETAGIRVTFCSTAYSGSFSCTSYPVFSAATTDGTSFYAANTPLKQLSPAGSFRAANTPAASFSSTSQEYESGGSPRRYKYILHTSGHTPATAYSVSVSASTAVVMFGSVDVRVASTASASFVSVCADAIEGGAAGGF